MTLCARLHGKNDIEEIFIHSSDQKYMEENEHGQSMTSSKLRPTLSERHRAERCRRAMWMKEYKMRLHASDETKEDELDKLEEDMRGGERRSFSNKREHRHEQFDIFLLLRHFFGL